MANRLSIEARKEPKAFQRDGGTSAGAALTGAATVLPRAESAPKSFDVEAWTTLIEEQRQRIAAAAGVDPAKVSIHIGH